MADPNTSTKAKDDPYFGMKLALTFVVLSIFLYFSKGFFGSKTVTYVVSLILAGTGAAGLGFELSRMNTDKGIRWGDLGAGVLLTVCGLTVHRFLDNWVLNVVVFLVLLFGFLGTISGMFDIIRTAISGNFDKREAPRSRVSLFIAIVQIVGLIAGILQSLAILKVIR